MVGTKRIVTRRKASMPILQSDIYKLLGKELAMELLATELAKTVAVGPNLDESKIHKRPSIRNEPAKRKASEPNLESEIYKRLRSIVVTEILERVPGHPIFAYLPKDLLMEILARLPTKSVAKFRCVCKYWKSALTSPELITKQAILAQKNSQ
ncbi:hypothetical protein CCACVL1_16007 [Corchorus capsularis]|uniref:F-box domain-containing protein n=1 Tax=Corchorus capsularis TaxID=210143 RepID=A0A1R3HZS5_COCAP|nr:hypothetical protein CCACVL1_16007 [Corchorus capsularis]